jgi:MinD-like ATPase involved in chromosome partitioning or flagellar assembly
MSAPQELRRRDLHGGPIVDGAPADRPAQRWQRRVARLLVSSGEREEAEFERLLSQQRTLTRVNLVAVVSPKGGVGKTTCAFALGNLIADRLRLRVVAVDANPDFGTLAMLAADPVRNPRTLADLLTDIEQIHTATDLRRYVSTMPTGLHLLGAPAAADLMVRLGPEAYGELLALLGTFYDLVVFDLGTGVGTPLAQLLIRRADQAVIVTTPEWVATSAVLFALEHLEPKHATVACNKFLSRGPADICELERRLRERGVQRSVAIPYDDQLACMLDSATYQVDALRRTTRTAIKRLGVAVCEQLI